MDMLAMDLNTLVSYMIHLVSAKIFIFIWSFRLKISLIEDYNSFLEHYHFVACVMLLSVSSREVIR